MADLPAVGVVDVWAGLLNTFLGIAHETSGANGGKIKQSAILNDISVRTITTTGNILTTDQNVLVNSAVDVVLTLPSATLATREIKIKRIHSGDYNITINTVSSQTIDGELSVDIGVQYEVLRFVSNGANWYLM